MNLASHLLVDAAHRDCKVAVVVSNDSDLKDPIELAQTEFGIAVGVVIAHPPNRRSLVLTPAFFKQLRKNALRDCQLPASLRDARGLIRKPAVW